MLVLFPHVIGGYQYGPGQHQQSSYADIDALTEGSFRLGPLQRVTDRTVLWPAAAHNVPT